MSNALDRDPLASLVPRDTDADRPWLVFYTIGERIELTGHVLAMWSSKIAGFLTSELSDGPQLALALPPHWRSVAWALGIWQSGGTVLPFPMSDAEQATPAGNSGHTATAQSAAWEGLSMDGAVAFMESTLPEADVQILLPRASLALSWEGADGEELPPLVFDGVADVMPYPDRISMPAWDGSTPSLAGTERTLTRADLRAAATTRAGELLAGAHGSNAGRGEVEEQVNDATITARTSEAAEEPQAPRAFLARTTTLEDCLIDCLAIWKLGRTAIIIDPHAPQALRATAISQEGT